MSAGKWQVQDLAPDHSSGLPSHVQTAAIADILDTESWPTARAEIARSICRADDVTLLSSIPQARNISGRAAEMVTASPLIARLNLRGRARLTNILTSRRVKSVDDLLARRPRDLAGHQLRSYEARQVIVEVLLESTARLLASSSDPIPAELADLRVVASTSSSSTWIKPVTEARLVVTWGRYRGHTTLGELLNDAEHAPSDVLESLEGFLRIPLADLGPDVAANPEQALQYFQAANSSLIPMLRWRLQLDTDLNTTSLAEAMGVSRQRVSQLGQRAIERLTHFIDSQDGEVIRWRAHDVAMILGSWIPFDLATLRHRSLLSEDPLFPDIVLWLAGPYESALGGFKKAGTVLEPDLITPFLGANRQIDIDGLTAELSRRGVLEIHVRALIEQLVETKTLGDTTYLWTGSALDKAQVVLAAEGNPMTPDQIMALMETDLSLRSLTSRMAQDERFVRTDINRYGLSEWDLEQYSTIAQEIEERIERNGGSVSLTELIADLTGTFSVKENSIRIYVATPHFIVEDGQVRLRKPEEVTTPQLNLRRAPDAYRQGSVIIWHTDITADHIRGSGSAIPNPIASWLGVAPGTERRFSGPYGDIVVSWRTTSTSGATISSLKAPIDGARVKLGSEIPEGSLLRLRLDSQTDRYEAELLDPADAPVEGVDFLAWRTGLHFPDGVGTESVLAKAVDADMTSVRSVLARRGDQSVLRALPVKGGHEELSSIGSLFARALLGGGDNTVAD